MAQLQWRSDDTISWKYGFGDGSDGSSYSVPANEGCSGTISTKTLTLATAGSFANDDLILIHQSRGTSVGTWQLNKIISGGGTTTLTLEEDLVATFTDSGSSQAQVITMHQYEDLTVGAVTSPLWDGSKGGLVAFMDKNVCTVNSTISTSGNGFKGFLGTNSARSPQGEGTAGAGGTQSRNANGNGGGGADNEYSGPIRGGAGGGGNGTAGGAGYTNSGGAPGYGGNAVGTASLVTMNLGGGGGGAYKDVDHTSALGGDGAGIVVIFAKELTVTGTIINTGGNGAGVSSNGLGSGGGAGGSVLLKAEIATLGTSKITASGGVGGAFTGNNGGGNGGVGRIHLDYSDSYSGTTTPTIDVTEDSTIITPLSGGGAYFLTNFI